MNRKIFCSLFEFTPKTLYNWKKEKRPIIELIERYFSEDDVKEFITTKKIDKLENIEHYLHYEKKLLDQIKDLLWSLDGKDGVFLLRFIVETEKAYNSLMIDFLTYQYEHPNEDLEKDPLYYQNQYAFTAILEDTYDQYGDVVGVAMAPIEIEKYILNNIFNIKQFSKFFTKDISPQSIYYIQKAIDELYKNDLLSLTIKNTNQLIQKVLEHTRELKKNRIEEMKQIDNYQDYLADFNVFETEKYPDGLPLNMSYDELEQEFDEYRDSTRKS